MDAIMALVGTGLLVLLTAILVVRWWPRRRRRKHLSTRTLHVPAQFPSIQSAMDEASPGDVVMVAPGVYRENLDFRGKGITVTSRDPLDQAVVATTIIEGDQKGPVVTFNGYEEPDSVLSGFTITNGSGELLVSLNVLGSSARVGGGIRIGSESGPIIRNNVITGNRADLGGGVYACSTSFPVLEDNSISHNHALLGGGVRVAGDFREPDAEDIYVHGQRITFTLKRCTISNNRASIGGGISIDRLASPGIVHSIIRDNAATWDGGGIAIWDRSSPEIIGNYIHRNRAGSTYGYGGGISVINTCKPTMVANTIEDNEAIGSAKSGGGGICVYRSSPCISNNVIRGNRSQKGPDLYLWSSAAPVLNGNQLHEDATAQRLAAGGLK